MSETNCNQRAADCLVDSLIDAGITYFCISPGSRNTNLVLSIARNPKAETMVHFDERGSSFHALGYGKATSRPAAVIVSSGTACGNLMPAIMEAHHSHTPLVILTSDRPDELRGCGSNQTTDQVKLFSSFVRWEKDFCLSTENTLPYLSSIASHAAHKAKSGPVHLNAMFREPFLSDAANEHTKAISYIETTNFSIDPFFISGKKPLIVVGMGAKDLEAIEAFSQTYQIPVFADILSNDRCFSGFSRSVAYYDLLISHIFEKPDVVFHFGSRIVSKTLFQWLSKSPPEEYILIDENDEHYNPSSLVTKRFVTSSVQFCENTTCSFSSKLTFPNVSIEIDENVEPGYMQDLSETFPRDSLLFLGNSMPIRNADRFFYPKNNPLQIIANRGVSGIDGNIASAFGVQIGSQKPVIAVLGDVTFLHDLNSLAQAKPDTPIVFVIFNNHGGGIFAHLPVYSQTDVFSRYFETKHCFSFLHICKQFSIQHFLIESRSDAKELFRKTFFDIKGPVVLEVVTDTKKNQNFYRDQLRSLKIPSQSNAGKCNNTLLATNNLENQMATP